MKPQMLSTGRVINENGRTAGWVSIHANGKTYRASRVNGENGVDARTASQGFRSTAAAVAWIARTTMLPMSAVERVWRKDFNNTVKAIPESWILTLDDGARVIHPDHANEPVVQLQRKLAIVGFARDWMD